MLKKLQKSKSEGFTIIEVMIVLAIAGLIILIVLLAVPALQRNSRNTAIKNDASAVAAGVSEYASNNDGGLVKGVVQAAGSSTVDLCDANPCGASVAKATVKVQGSTVVTYKGAATASSATTSPGSSNIWLFSGEKCDGTASPRATQVVYAVEVAGSANGTAKCIDS